MNKWLDRYESGGLVSKNSLNRNVTCSNCGWSWKLSDGGLDPMTCHKCGGDIKMKEGGELDEYQDRGQVRYTVPTSDNLQYQKPIVSNFIVDPLSGGYVHNPARAAALLNQPTNAGTISKTKDRSVGKQIYNVATNPMTSAQQLINKQPVTGLGPKNPYDFAFDAFPAMMAARQLPQIPGNIQNGEYLQAGLNALSVIPFLPKIPRGLPRVLSEGQPYEGAPHIYEDMVPINGRYQPRTVITDAGVKDEILGLEATPIIPLNQIEYPVTSNKFLYGPHNSFGKMDRGLSGNIGDTSWERFKEKMEMHKWMQEQLEFNELPQTKNKESLGVLEDFKTRIQTPEGQKRLKELGITNDEFLKKLDIVEDPNTYGYYTGSDNKIVMNPNNPLPKKVVRHEIEHGVQTALQNSNLNKVIKASPYEKLKALESGKTEIDDILSGLELKKEGTPNKVWDKSTIEDGKPVDITEYKSKILNKQRATDYFLTGSEGKEKSAFLAEVQQHMMDKGIIPKTSYAEITPEMVKETFTDAMFDEQNGGKYLRLFNIMKPTENNYKLISKGLNKMLSIVPYTIPAAIGAGALNQKQQGGPIVTNRGQWDYPGQTTIIPSNEITMQGVPYPVIGVDNTGHTKMMQPGMNYTFPGQYVTEYPMAQNGYQVQPTRQDSLDVMNSQIALNKFYDNEVKNGRLTKDVNGVFNSFYPFENLNDKNLNFYRTQIKDREENKKMGFTQTGTYDDVYKNIFNLNPSDVSKLEYQGLGKTKLSNTYKKYYRDLITPMQNLASPFALFDTRIRPQHEINYSSNKYDYPGGDVTVLDYDPIVVKPADLKTKADWDYVKKNYPELYKEPGKPEPGKPVEIKKKTSPRMQFLHPWYMQSSPISMQGQPMQIQPMVFPQQHGEPVYGPGHTIIGYSNDNMKFNPAYQYTGAPNNQFNLQDKELLNNPELLKQYIYNQDSGYHYKTGGEMIKRADGSYSKRGLWDNIRDNRGSGKAPTKQMLDQERKIRNQYQTGGAVTLNTGGEQHRIYVKSTNRGEGDKGHIMVNHPTMDKGMWDTIDLTQKAGAKTIAQGVAATKKWHRENPYKKQLGGEEKLWYYPKEVNMNEGRSYYNPPTETFYINPNNNIENPEIIRQHELYHHLQNINGGLQLPQYYSGPLKKPNMMANDELQGSYYNRRVIDEKMMYDKKIKKHPDWQFIPRNIIYNPYNTSLGTHVAGTDEMMYEEPSTVEGEAYDYQNYVTAGGDPMFANGGYVVRRSHDRKGKTHVVIGPDGTKKYFGDPNMGERGKSKYGKEAFYARHKSNLAKNPYFRAYARATWKEGGETMAIGGQTMMNPVSRKDNRNWLEFLKN